MLSKSLIQFSVDGQGCVPSLLFDLRPNYGGGNEDNGNLLHALIFITSMYGASLVAQRLKRPPPMRETRVRSLSREDPLEKEMAIHSSILAWRSNGRRSLVVIAHGVTKSRTRLSNFTHSLTLYLHYLHHSLASGQTTVRAHSPTHQKKIGLKIY